MSNNILDEYTKITRIIENIQDKINRYKITIEQDLERSSSEKEKNMIIKEFEKKIKKIRDNPQITKRYRYFKKRQEMLRRLLILSDKTETDKLLQDLQIKYYNLSKKNSVC